MLPADYYKMSPVERINHWIGLIHREMRFAGESGCEEITIFNRTFLDQIRQDEPEIDRYLAPILTRLSFAWATDPVAFIADVNSRMGTRFAYDPIMAAAKLGPLSWRTKMTLWWRYV
jgi:hypothetical protein